MESPRWSRSLWLAAAPILFWSAGRRGRRAALRGTLSAAITGLLLSLVRRVTSGRGPSPTIGAAAAFATGAGIELPPGALAALGALPAVTDDRPTDVVGGAAVGAAVAVATTRVWRIPPKEGAEAPPTFVPADAEPSPDGGGLTIVVNRASGSEKPSDLLRELERGLPGATIVEVEADGGDDLERALEEAAAEGTALGIAGGDGSINTAAQVAMKAGKPLMVVPSGTFNHLTEALGIGSVEDAITAVKAGQCVEIDVGCIDQKVFLNTASFGSYVEFVDARERLEHKIGKWPAVVVALVRVLRHSEPICIEIEDREMQVWLAFIGNCRYRPSGFAPSWRERFDDGMLDLRVIDGSHPWARTRLVAAVITGSLGRSRVYRESLEGEIKISSLEGPLRVARDGETFESSEEIAVTKMDERLAIYAPHDPT